MHYEPLLMSFRNKDDVSEEALSIIKDILNNRYIYFTNNLIDIKLSFNNKDVSHILDKFDNIVVVHVDEITDLNKMEIKINTKIVNFLLIFRQNLDF